MPLHVSGTIGAYLLCSTRLACYAVSLHGGFLSPARSDNLLQETYERLICSRINGTAYLFLLYLLVQGAIGILYGFDDMRLQEDSIVCDSPHCRHELKRRDSDTMSYGHRRDIGRAHILRIEQQARFLTRQAYACALTEAEKLGILCKPVCAEIEPDHGESGIQ